ncbi:MAG: acylphosphatase [Sedimentisphaerales bacterium]|jgi:acylphosphatase
MVARHVIFVGRVQGVGFRFTAHRIATRHRLTGYVRNAPDGTVEMLAQGQAKEIGVCLQEIAENFTGYIRETRIEEIPLDPKRTSFRITF